MNLDSVDVGTLSHVIGLTPRQIQRLVKDGVLPRKGRGRYDLAACVQSWAAHLIQGKAPEGLSTERRRLVAAQATRAELEAQRMAGSLLDAEDVRIVINSGVTTLVRNLESLPGTSGAAGVDIEPSAPRPVAEKGLS